MNRCLLSVLPLTLIIGACTDQKPPFSRDQFVLAKKNCGATDAYIVEAVPNTIGFHGTSDDHIGQAKCLKAKLAGTNVETVVVGSQRYEAR